MGQVWGLGLVINFVIRFGTGSDTGSANFVGTLPIAIPNCLASSLHHLIYFSVFLLPCTACDCGCINI